MRAYIVPAVALLTIFLGPAGANAGCLFHQDSATVCTMFGSCTTTLYISLVCSSDSGGDGGGGGGGGGTGGNSGPDLTASQRQALENGMKLATSRLESLTSCAGMYTELNLLSTNGLNFVYTTEYVDGSSTMECALYPNAMWTNVGSGVVYVCHGVPNLRNADVAMLMLHESLHTAGQYESPEMPGAPTSAALSGFVRDRCNLH